MKNYILLLIIGCSFFCCSDDDILRTANKHVPLAIGNYWIYQEYHIDLDGNERVNSPLDSVVITGDSLINGNTYYVFEGTNLFSSTWGVIALRRDSAEYVVDQNGIIHFSAENFNDTLYHQDLGPAGNSTWISVDYQMKKPTQQINVPAGVFEVLDYEGLFQTNMQTPYPLPRSLHRYYAEDVGLVLSNTFAFSSTSTIESRLVRYHIEN